ncbi:hypothetical protein MF271_09630 [Deinococcus sp. KNUC1210]|uniref:hypothetical protein n=1 Tax=Deinococcus sp. KNUC1210 TaxID=2917691 RepID=UPI001EF0A556|nr:hypothetical protein [Deinococcus sp. KNUC1210]ULH16801.1 hypothetical protein MF271_09630 [Deinococcus sp. KNUC1210]
MIEDVIQKIRAAEVAADRAPGSVRLVAVSKGHSLAQIRRHILASSQLQPGGFPLAENRGQELRDKLDQIRAEQDDTRGGQEHAPSQWPPSNGTSSGQCSATRSSTFRQ